jgi:hypothetical protein
MLALAQDLKRRITFALHVGGPLTDAELKQVLVAIDASAEALAKAGSDAFCTTVILVETDHGPTATQRKQLGEASRKITRHYQVLVTRSAVVRAIMTAIRWFYPAEQRKHQDTFATYEAARVWLVEHTGHPGEVFDKMIAEVRAKASAERGGQTASP